MGKFMINNVQITWDDLYILGVKMVFRASFVIFKVKLELRFFVLKFYFFK